MSKKPMQQMVALSSLVLLSAAPARSVRAGMTMGGGCVSKNISVKLVQTPLDFGSYVPCTGATGKVSIRYKGTVKTKGCFDATFGGAQRAQVKVDGGQTQATHFVQIIIKTNTAINAGPNSMNITDIQIDGVNKTTVTIKGNKSTVLGVGGILNSGAGQASGTYTGNVTLTAVCL